jgi:single-strand DNA-binding protein
MKDVNKIILVGRLGSDPIQRSTKAGTPVVQLSIATSRRIYREDAEGTQEASPVEETQWHRVIAWGKRGEACAQYLKKGHSIYVEGYVKSRQYESKEGEMKTVYEVHAEDISFLGTPRLGSKTEEAEAALNS